MNRRHKKEPNPTLIKIGNLSLIAGRWILGLVFIFSGVVKAIDPLGFTYKITDYLTAFGPIFSHLNGLAFTTAVTLSTIELTIGLCLVFKTNFKLTTILALLFMLVMTPLTLYIALKNPVSDCGCFGDAVKISNWETFFKNIVLSAITIVLLVYNKKISSDINPINQWKIALGYVLFGCGLSIYCYTHLPLIDFLPYKVGVNIPESMVVPEDAISDEFETTFIYSKNGVQKEFTLANYPKNDTSWVFVDQKTVLIKKGYEPPIHDFSITNSYGENITEDVLYKEGETYLLTAYDINSTSEKGAQKAEKIYQSARKRDIPFFALTASSASDIQIFRAKTGVTFPFFTTDPTTLKTMIRANPGLIKLKKGTIVGKWNWRDFPME